MGVEAPSNTTQTPSVSSARVHVPRPDDWLLKHGQEILDQLEPSPTLGDELANAPTARLYKEMEFRGPKPGEFDGDGIFFSAITFSKRRAHFRHLFSYAIPTPRAVSRIAEFADGGGICEVGAGRGLWARLLSEQGVSVDATDYAIVDDGLSNAKSGYFNESKHVFFPVRREFARRAAANTPANTLMLVWPPYANPVAALALQNFKGDRLVYIGEDEGGCTADDDFFEILASDWERVDRIGIPRWETLHDSVQMYRRARK